MEHQTLREANLARAKEWAGAVELDLSFAGNELAGETGEACNIIKKLERQRLGIKSSPASAADLREELSDVIICVDLIAMRFGFDMEQAVKDKFNKTSIDRDLETRYI